MIKDAHNQEPGQFTDPSEIEGRREPQNFAQFFLSCDVRSLVKSGLSPAKPHKSKAWPFWA